MAIMCENTKFFIRMLVKRTSPISNHPFLSEMLMFKSREKGVVRSNEKK
jgi:hypothetical protein